MPINGGEAVVHDGRVIGRLRSCAYGFVVRRNLAYAYLPVELKPGATIQVEVFGNLLPALVLPDRQLAFAEARQHAG
ncbi:MAG: hypothetical protein E6J28_02890 [Chloroflexi bacterium]|nr:MAG: hypothetical protein E6J28_02890 [Chloroflexota bacterium]